MFRVPIRSRVGNGVLGVIGVIYFFSAVGTLIYYLVSTWGAMGLTDYALQLALLASAVGGLFFIAIAAQNMGLTQPGSEKSRSAHQAAAPSGL